MHMTKMHLDMNYCQYCMKHIEPKYLFYHVLVYFCGWYEVYYLRKNSIPHFHYDILDKNACAKFNKKIVAFI